MSKIVEKTNNKTDNTKLHQKLRSEKPRKASNFEQKSLELLTKNKECQK